MAAGINDLGSIKWKSASIQTGNAATNFIFDGFSEINGDSISDQLDQIKEDASKLFKFKPATTVDNLVDKLPYNLNVSAEYSLFNSESHDILIGLLYRNYKIRIANKQRYCSSIDIETAFMVYIIWNLLKLQAQIIINSDLH